MPARCVMRFSYQERYTQEFFIDNIGQDAPPEADQRTIEERKEHARQKLELIIKYARTHRCRRQMILDYFGDESDIGECSCDVCRQAKGISVDGGAAPALAELPESTVTLIRQMLSAIARPNGR